MAFIDQVQDLTSITVSDTDELSQFLKDGVMDVTNKWLLVRPQDIELFGRESAETTSNASLNLNGARIISVIREDGTNNQWRNCTKISPSLQYDVTDTDSLNYASKINPAYMIGEDNQVSVFPVATSSPAQNAYKIYYVNAEPTNTSDATLAYSHSDIKYFPEEKVRLVVLYAGMRSLQSVMAGMHGNASIESAFTSFKSNMLLAINHLDFSKKAADRIDSNLYNAMNFDSVQGRFKQAVEALNKANELVDGNAPAEGYNAFSYHLREDPELVTAALNLSATEVKHAQSIVAELTAMEELALKEVQSYLGIGAAYMQDAQQYLSQVQLLSAEATKEYTWYQTRYREIKGEYDQAFGLIQPPQPQREGAR